MDLGFVDLVEVPFTVPGSRFVVRRDGDWLAVYHVRYEVPLADCLVLRVRALGPADSAAPEAAVPARTSRPAPGAHRDDRITVWSGHLRTPLLLLCALEDEVRLAPAGERLLEVVDGPAPDIDRHRDGRSLALTAAGATPSALRGADFTEAADAAVDDWMRLAPAVLPAREDTTRHCWWVLGSNLVRLAGWPGAPGRAVVVPSKVGYVALWQWDTYFISVGLRHGALDLALDQLDVALSPAPDGQLPDVVHDTGTLATSADLPAADRERLLAAGSPTTAQGEVPLTKPPLTAWAVDRALSGLPAGVREQWLRRWFPTVLASQDWWFAVSDSDHDGVPEYLHPYSSGLDDSPVFDHALPVTSPDLLGYLVVQDETLARWCRQLPDLAAADPRLVDRLTARAARVREALDRSWHDEAGMFRARAGAEALTDRTVVALLGCFAGDLQPHQLAGVLADIADPARFATAFPLPTVALDDPAFRAEQMWRGPTWINTTYLVAEGLERCGATEQATRLRRSAMAAVESAGPVEYVSAATGRRCPGATGSFAWSAALYVDLAAREAAEAG